MPRPNLLLFVICSIFATTYTAFGAECHGAPDPDAKENPYAIRGAELKLLSKVRNGKLYAAGDANSALRVLHVWGSPYEMGYAHGTLLKTEASSFMNAVWAYLEDQVVTSIAIDVRLAYTKTSRDGSLLARKQK